MASSAVQKAFIKEIAPHAQAAYKALGKVYPSICIAMACVESGYGTSSIMRKYNAFLGQKVGTVKVHLALFVNDILTAGNANDIGHKNVVRAHRNNLGYTAFKGNGALQNSWCRYL